MTDLPFHIFLPDYIEKALKTDYVADINSLQTGFYQTRPLC